MKLDVKFINGRFRTLDAARPRAGALGVLRGRIVGLDEEIDGLDAREVVDLGGAPAVPGLHDAHFHTSMVGARLASLDVSPVAVTSLDELYEAVAAHAEHLAEDEWIRGVGYDQNVLGAHPDARALDAVAGGRPVMLEHASRHMLTANTEAFRRAGITDMVRPPSIDGGAFLLDDDGRANGVVQERAMEMFYELVRPTPDDELLRNLALASDQALRWGLTALTEPGIGAWRSVGNSPSDLHLYQRAVEENVLVSRTTVMPYYLTLHDVGADAPGFDWFGLDLGMRTGLGDDRLRVGPVKIMSDGSFIGRSAAMRDCYCGEPDNKGILHLEPDELEAAIVRAHCSGWTVATHAIGDRAIDSVLDAIETAQQKIPRSVRHRIEHFALADDDQVDRAAKLGVIGVPQGRFITEFGDGMRDAVAAERSPHIYRMKSLLNRGMVLPGSTDAPVADGNPLLSIHDMVNRRTASGDILGPDERLSAEEALVAYTYGSAYAVGQENQQGALSAGMVADFVVLSDDLLTIPHENIKDQTVGATIIGGRVEYDDGALG